MKKVIITILLAITIGISFAIFMYHKYYDDTITVSNEVKEMGYAIQIGVFNNYDNALKLKDKYDGIIINDNDKYRVYVAIIKDSNILLKVKKYYNDLGLSYYVKQIPIPSNIIDTINKEEQELLNSDQTKYSKILKNVLKEYEKNRI